MPKKRKKVKPKVIIKGEPGSKFKNIMKGIMYGFAILVPIGIFYFLLVMAGILPNFFEDLDFSNLFNFGNQTIPDLPDIPTI